jgi:hypothetical protein
MWGLDELELERLLRLHLPKTPETNALVIMYLKKHHGQLFKEAELRKALDLFYEFMDYRIHEDFRGICSSLVGYIENDRYWRWKEAQAASMSVTPTQT